MTVCEKAVESNNMSLNAEEWNLCNAMVTEHSISDNTQVTIRLIYISCTSYSIIVQVTSSNFMTAR